MHRSTELVLNKPPRLDFNDKIVYNTHKYGMAMLTVMHPPPETAILVKAVNMARN